MDAATAWLKAMHIVALLAWSATLFYLPSLLAAHPATAERTAYYRLRAMTRTVYIGVASPAAIIAIVSGTALIVVADAHGGWLVLKLTGVALMVAYHVYCGALVAAFRERPKRRRPGMLHALVVIPAILVPLVFYLVLGKPV